MLMWFCGLRLRGRYRVKPVAGRGRKRDGRSGGVDFSLKASRAKRADESQGRCGVKGGVPGWGDGTLLQDRWAGETKNARPPWGVGSHLRLCCFETETTLLSPRG